ncbi:hypothetical protein AALM99_07575 [Lactococcus muris]|uniref:Uncharacterized protein n=1 Tax=Lactococcus muris TaxID=2941330 RepID=A0ABV4DB73_9LACT
MPSGKVERIERTPGFTQIDNKLLTDKSLGLEGIGLMSHLLHYSKTFEVYKSVLHREWGRATVEKAWKKATKAGYIIAFKNYSTNSTQDSYNYTFDEFKFFDFDLMSYFEEKWAAGYLFYDKTLYQVANRTLENIEAALPQFLFPNEDSDTEEKERLDKLRKALAQFVFERLPREKTESQEDYPSQTFEEQAFEKEENNRNNDDSKVTFKEASSHIDNFVQDFPEYLSCLKRLEEKNLKPSDLEEIVETLYNVGVDIDLQFDDVRKRIAAFESIFEEQFLANELYCQYDWVGYFKKGIKVRLKDYLLPKKLN